MAISNVFLELILAFGLGLIVGLTLAMVAAKRKKEIVEHAVLEEIRAESEADDQANDPEPDPAEEEEEIAEEIRAGRGQLEAEIAEVWDRVFLCLRRSHAEEAMQFVWAAVAPADRVTTEDVADILGIDYAEAESLLREAEEEHLCFETTSEPEAAEEEEEEEEEEEAPDAASTPKVGGQPSRASRAISFVWGYKGFSDRITTEEVAKILRISVHEANSLLREAQDEHLCFETGQDQVWEITI